MTRGSCLTGTVSRHIVLGFSLAMSIAVRSPAQSAVSDSVRIARLSAVGRLWGVVRYFHPSLGDRDGGWDASAAAAIERVRTAGTVEEYAAVVGDLLATLHDPATRVLPPQPGAPASAGMNPVTIRWAVAGIDSTLVVGIPAFDDSTTARLRQVAPEVRRAPRVVFDLRGQRPSDESDAAGSFAESGVDALLPATRVAAPASRSRTHSGFPTQVGTTSGGYFAGVVEVPGQVFNSRPDITGRRIVFLVNSWTDVPPIAFALRSNGQGAVVIDGATALLDADAQPYAMSLGEGTRATVRLSQSTGTMIDTALSGGDAPYQAALALAHRGIAPVAAPILNVTNPIDTLPRAAYPPVGYRVLAAYQWWNAIHYFYPNKALTGENWDAVLPHAIAHLEAARDSLEYALAIVDMVKYIHDSHGSVTAGRGALAAYWGVGFAGALLQYIRDEPVVTAVAEDSATRASGIAVGDVIVKVDGENVAARKARLERTIAFSTPQALNEVVASLLLRGPAGTARVTVRDRQDRVRELSVPRSLPTERPLRFPPTGPILKVLPGNIGYADLERLTVAMVDSMFEMFRNTKAIIFDDRSYPQGTAWSIAPRLTDRDAVPAALFERPLVLSPDSTTWATYQFVQYLPTTTKWRYHGKTVLLVDERTISQAEHTGLFLEAANHTTIIGSPTMGANGDVTAVAFAGGARAYFSGHGVRHADGRQLQRIGLQPDIVVRPTLQGIRAGRDEVLERALMFLSMAKH